MSCTQIVITDNWQIWQVAEANILSYRYMLQTESSATFSSPYKLLRRYRYNRRRCTDHSSAHINQGKYVRYCNPGSSQDRWLNAPAAQSHRDMTAVRTQSYLILNHTKTCSGSQWWHYYSNLSEATSKQTWADLKHFRTILLFICCDAHPLSVSTCRLDSKVLIITGHHTSNYSSRGVLYKRFIGSTQLRIYWDDRGTY